MFRTFNEFKKSIEEEKEKKIRQMEENPNISFFFQKDKEIFAGSEESRLAFARLKNPDKEDKNWAIDGDFSAMNMKDAISGESGEHLFNSSSLNKIKVIDKEEAFKLLRKK